MDLKAIKLLTAYAQKMGVRLIRVDGLELEFFPGAQEPKAPASRLVVNDILERGPDKAPTLQEINDYIYTDGDA